MTDQTDTLSKLFADCWKDEALKERFIADPKTVLSEYGMEVPDELDIAVVANTDSKLHLTLPAKPQQVELSDEELSSAAGGGTVQTLFGCQTNITCQDYCNSPEGDGYDVA